MEKYDPHKIESKWQKIWEGNKYGISEDFSEKPKHYHLVEFPYPSGSGLHVGHCMGYGASDAYCRMKRMQGFNVMYPIGWDAFGLPTENYAIKTGVHPAKATADNVANFKKQMKSLAYSFDWEHEVNTADPNYYKWTQWIFLQFYKHAIVDGELVEVEDDDPSTSSHSSLSLPSISTQALSLSNGRAHPLESKTGQATPRLAYQAEMPINWCPSCKIGLANEEVINGKCERCGTEVVKKMQKQWMLRITAYAERLIKDLDTVEYLDKIKTQQINWIGKSEGTNIVFRIQNTDKSVEVFTTRTDTLFGVTYIVLSPEHLLIQNLKSKIENLKEVEEYIGNAAKKSDLERAELDKEKTGVKLKGIKAINPINDEEIDIWIADYVLANYGTGAVMAVPAHDQRDFEFADKYNIPIKSVVKSKIAKYIVIEKSLDSSKIKELETYGKVAIQKVDEDWGKFFEVTVSLDNEQKFITFLKDNLLATSEQGGGWYADSLGYTNIVVYPQKTFHISDSISAKEAKDYGMSIGIIEKQVDFTVKSFEDYGVLINSNDFNDLTSKEAKKKITEKLKERDAGDFSVNYKLRDWIFSRQHYWGEPIPIIHCMKCGTIPLKEKDLPLSLPDVKKYEPTNTGESPLAAISDWVNVKCPQCGGDAKRETDTMPNWAGSSWYYLRYCDPNNNAKFASMDKLEYWLKQTDGAGSAPRSSKSGGGVDIYNGGMEHTTLHLLYSRFWHKFLYDLKKVPTLEPYQKRIAHGIILGPDGQKMSKSRGNVVNPDSIVKQYGADTLRVYIMFIGPYDQESAWNTSSVQGVSRFLNRVWNNFDKVKDDIEDNKDFLVKLNQSIAGISEDMEAFRMNTVVSKLMELNNAIEKAGSISADSYKTFLKLLFPVAPHLSEELWQQLGEKGLIEDSTWPTADKKYLVADEIEIVVQVNGKVRGRFMADSNVADEELKQAALGLEKIKPFLQDKEIVKVIIVSGKLVSIVTK